MTEKTSDCPECKDGKLRYIIHNDTYKCTKCSAEFYADSIGSDRPPERVKS